jgi:hypothetical protein
LRNSLIERHVGADAPCIAESGGREVMTGGRHIAFMDLLFGGRVAMSVVELHLLDSCQQLRRELVVAVGE